MRKIFSALVIAAFLSIWMTGCGHINDAKIAESDSPQGKIMTDISDVIGLDSEIIELEKGFEAVKFEGDDGFEEFLSQGGGSSDSEVVRFLTEHLIAGTDLEFMGEFFGCSTIAVSSPDGERLFGRNFDWNKCEAMAVSAYPENGYASISTVNMDFIKQGAGNSVAEMALNLDTIRTLAALYAPLDGMNIAGLAVSVNMIQDGAVIAQDTEKPDITTTTAIRLLLNKAADVEEALEMLGQYDMHSSMGMMVHFALADRSGRSVVVEYVDNEMIVTETPVVTNFYFAKGEKNGVGTAQSHERYEILMQALKEQETMDMQGVRDALSSVSKGNFGEFESTEWSIAFDLDAGVAHYYHRENYKDRYTFALSQEESR